MPKTAQYKTDKREFIEEGNYNMAGQEFSAAAPNKNFVRVYPLNLKELIAEDDTSIEPLEEQEEAFSETGNEQYFVINRDGTSDIIAVDPGLMASEFQGNISDLSVKNLETRFTALQEAFAARPNLLEPPLHTVAPASVTPQMMTDALSVIQPTIDIMVNERRELDQSMIAHTDDTSAQLSAMDSEIEALQMMVKNTEELAPLIDDSYQLINLIEGDKAVDNTLTSDQYDAVHRGLFGVEPSEDHQIPAYGKG